MSVDKEDAYESTRERTFNLQAELSTEDIHFNKNYTFQCKYAQLFIPDIFKRNKYIRFRGPDVYAEIIVYTIPYLHMSM